MGDGPGDKKKGGLDGEFERVVVGAFELAGDVVKDGPQLADAVLNSKAVQEKIQGWIVDEAMKGAKEGNAQSVGSVFISGDPADAAKRLLDAVQGEAKDELLKQIKKMPAFKRLDGRIDKLGEAFKATPTGVFLEKNKTWLIIVGVLASIGGMAVLYVKRTGDGPLSLIEGKDVKIGTLGKVEFKAGATKLEPSTQTFGAKVLASAKFGKVSVTTELSGAVSGDKEYLQVGGKATIEYEPKQDLTLKFVLDGSTYKLTPLAFGQNKPIAGLDPGARERSAWTLNAAASLKWKIDEKGDFNLSLGTSLEERWIRSRFELGYNYRTKGLGFQFKGGLGLDSPLGDPGRGAMGVPMGKDPFRPGLNAGLGLSLWF